MRGFEGVITAVSLMSLACASAPPTTPGKPFLAAEYHVGAADVLGITVRPEPVITRQVTVRPDGSISFDWIGDVKVEGKTVSEVRDVVTARLGEYIKRPDVAVELQQSNSRRFSIFGEVNRPGSFPLVGRLTAAEALARAGTATFLAAANKSRLIREGSEGRRVYLIRYYDIVERGDSTTDYELTAGDIIYVPPGVMGRIGNVVRLAFHPFQQVISLVFSAILVSAANDLTYGDPSAFRTVVNFPLFFEKKARLEGKKWFIPSVRG